MNLIFKKHFLPIYFLCFLWLPKHIYSQIPGSTEGMWLPEQLSEIDPEMRRLGSRLSIEKIYSESTPSLNDAVVRLNNGQCTAAIISASGLLLTNHHCLIESLAGTELKNWKKGFWATGRSEEIPIDGLTASLLVKIKNVTEEVVGPSFEDRAGIEARKQSIIEIETAETDYTAEIKSFYHGSEYRLYVYKELRDIRLLGLPSHQLARWGYGPEEWDWPRYSADFAFLRMYMAPDSSSADYAAENIPYKAAFHFPISLAERKEKDFSMILGYPGATHRYISASELQYIMEENNPIQAELLEQKAELLSNEIDRQTPLKGFLLDKYLDIARTAYYYRGQIDMLKRFDVRPKKEEREIVFQKWISRFAARTEDYGAIIPEIESLFDEYREKGRFVTMFYRGLLAADATTWSLPFLFRIKPIMETSRDSRMVQNALKPIKANLNQHFRNFDKELDQQIFYRGLIQFYKQVTPDLHPAVFREILLHKSTRKGTSTEDKLRLWVADAYEHSVLTDKARIQEFLQKPDLAIIQKDPLFNFMEKVISHYRAEIALKETHFNLRLEDLNRKYMIALREMGGRVFYPDANTTFRISYGQIKGYEPQDAIIYEAFCHFGGMLEGQTQQFQLPKELLENWRKQEFGSFGQMGKLPVSFLTNNDISAGNSGSPVLNAKGELIGCVFDANREAMASDYQFLPAYQRSLSVDIRFILWLTKYLGKAEYLFEEMKIVQ